MLDAAHLSRSFGSRLAVDDVSFHVAPGETYGLLGPNGAGKTTTIRLVCGLLSANTGEVTVCGTPVSASTTTAKAQIGYVPQDVSLYPDLTARENLSFFGGLYRLSGAALSKRVDEVLELIDLTDRGNDRVESYSGGMERRLNIRASLLHRPRPLVLDADRWGRPAESTRHPGEHPGPGVGGPRGAGFATNHSSRSFEQNLATARFCSKRETPVVPIRTEVVNRKTNFLPLGYNYSAPTMLVLFVFINALAGGAAMIQTRRFGVFARAFAAPVRPRDLVLGETLCYLTLALGQALFMVLVGAVMFGVSWGNRS